MLRDCACFEGDHKEETCTRSPFRINYYRPFRMEEIDLAIKLLDKAYEDHEMECTGS